MSDPGSICLTALTADGEADSSVHFSLRFDLPLQSDWTFPHIVTVYSYLVTMPAGLAQALDTIGSAHGIPDITPFPRRFPDDLLDCVCAELDRMKSCHPMNVPPTTADNVIQRTLLSIQTINTAGWRAATPFLWRTLRFKKKDDYVSFFIPITRLLQRTPHIQQPARVSQASFLMDQGRDHSNGDHHRNDLRRFFRSAQWIRNLVFDSAPPLNLREEIDLAHTIAVEVLGTACYLGRGISLHVDGLTVGLTDLRPWDPELGLVRRFIGDTRLAKVEAWDPPFTGDVNSHSFWSNLRKILGLASNYAQLPLTIHSTTPGPFRCTLFQDVTVRLGSEWALLSRPADPSEMLASILGNAVSARICHDHEMKDTSPNAVVIREFPRLSIWGWLGCPCGCDKVSCPESDVRVIIKMITRYALQALKRSWLRGMPRHLMKESIRTCFEEKRLEICGEPCARYKERERMKGR